MYYGIKLISKEAELCEVVMTEKQIQYAKALRQKIMAIAISSRCWSRDQLHQYMIEWGYGNK